MVGDYGHCKCCRCQTRARHKFTYSEYIGYIRNHPISSTVGTGTGSSQDTGDEAGRQAEEEKMQRLLTDPILKPLLEDLCQWLGRILEIEITPDNFTVPLQTGDDLCRLALAISNKATEQGMDCPKLRFRAGAKAGSFQARCNIEAFVKWAKDLGVRETCLFETVDIVELKFLRNVLICLLEISRLADKYGVEPPELVKLEKSTKIRWQDLIKLSMKRNSSGEVLTVAAISSTVGEIQDEVNRADEEGLGVERSSSVVKKWKSFTRTSLRSRGEVISPDPNRILDEMQSSSPRFGTPDSMLSDLVRSPDSTIGIVEEVPETQEAPETKVIEVGEVDNAASLTVGSPIPGTAASIGSVTAASPDVDIKVGEITQEEITFQTAGQSPSDQDPELGFEDITEDLDSDKAEVILTLEEVSLPDDEDMTVEEISLDDQDVGISVEQNLVEAVHSQPDFGAPELTVDEQAKQTLESEPLVVAEVTLDLETEDIALDDQEIKITVEQNLVEAVHAPAAVHTRPAADVALEVKPVEIVVSAPDTVGETVDSSDEEDFSEESEDSEDEGYPPVSPQLEIETSPQDVTVEEVLVLDPGNVVTVYETEDRVMPSAPAMEILVHSEDRKKVPVSAGLAGSIEDGKVDPGDQDGHTNLAYDGDSIGSPKGPASSGPEASTSVSATTSTSVPPGTSKDDDESLGAKIDVTWWFALCFPAVFAGNKDEPSLSQEQVEELEFKRSVYLLVGLILTIIGAALAITAGILGIDNGSGAEGVGVLTITWFFVILGIALGCLIIGLSLISLWVVQHIKMRNRKLKSFDNPTDYGSIR